MNLRGMKAVEVHSCREFTMNKNRKANLLSAVRNFSLSISWSIFLPTRYKEDFQRLPPISNCFKSVSFVVTLQWSCFNTRPYVQAQDGSCNKITIKSSQPDFLVRSYSRTVFIFKHWSLFPYPSIHCAVSIKLSSLSTTCFTLDTLL